MDQLKAAVERRQKASLWGQPRFITPRLAKRIYGDGQLLMAVIPLNTRPNYYVVRVDSSWAKVPEHSLFSRLEIDDDMVRERIDEIVTDLEDQFGCARYEEDSPRRIYARKFPAVSADVGLAWALLHDDKLKALVAPKVDVPH